MTFEGTFRQQAYGDNTLDYMEGTLTTQSGQKIHGKFSRYSPYLIGPTTIDQKVWYGAHTVNKSDSW